MVRSSLPSCRCVIRLFWLVLQFLYLRRLVLSRFTHTAAVFVASVRYAHRFGWLFVCNFTFLFWCVLSCRFYFTLPLAFVNHSSSFAVMFVTWRLVLMMIFVALRCAYHTLRCCAVCWLPVRSLLRCITVRHAYHFFSLSVHFCALHLVRWCVTFSPTLFRVVFARTHSLCGGVSLALRPRLVCYWHTPRVASILRLILHAFV